MGRLANTVERFWSKVRTSQPNECWPWPQCRTLNGYGIVRWQRQNQLAHRLAYQLHHGIELPRNPKLTKSSVLVLHTCDNRLCCNPAHLWLGTYRENNRDCLSKGRANTARGENSGSSKHPERKPRGTQHFRSKLTDDQARAIRARADAGERLTHIARDFGINSGTVWHIRERITWKHI